MLHGQQGRFVIDDAPEFQSRRRVKDWVSNVAVSQLTKLCVCVCLFVLLL